MKFAGIAVFLCMISTLCRAENSLPGFRALIRTKAEIQVAGQKRTVETVATIAVKGNKYRVQMVQPTPQWFVCDGVKTVFYNPSTGASSEIQASSLDQAGAISLMAKCSGKNGPQNVDASWGLPDEVKSVNIETRDGQLKKVTLFSKESAQIGTIEIKATQPLGKETIPTEIHYLSQSQDPRIFLVITYRDLQLEENMPEETFELGLKQ